MAYTPQAPPPLLFKKLSANERATLVEWIVASRGGERADYQHISDEEIENIFAQIQEESLKEQEL